MDETEEQKTDCAEKFKEVKEEIENNNTQNIDYLEDTYDLFRVTSKNNNKTNVTISARLGVRITFHNNMYEVIGNIGLRLEEGGHQQNGLETITMSEMNNK
jgi:hypothetical protein